jgi:Galactose oxidase, central domain
MKRIPLLSFGFVLILTRGTGADPVPAPDLNVSGSDLIVSIDTSITGRIYRLQQSATLAAASWTSIATKTAADANGVEFLVDDGALVDHGFYRIALVDPGSWRIVDSSGPSEGGMVAYDTDRHVAVMFACVGSYANDTWEFDGTSWRQINVPGSLPPARDGSGKMVYDPEGNRIVMLGGWWPDDNDPWTWEYIVTGPGPNDREWRAVTSSGPGQRGAMVMAWDSSRRKALLFGGNRYQTFYNDTWTFDAANNTWQNLGGWGPSRFAAGLVYDSRRDRFVMFGGTGRWWSGDYEYGRGNTNEFDPATGTWTEIVAEGTPGTPGPRWFPTMVYDPVSGVTLLMGGGRPSNGQGYEDQWIWDGTSWLEIPLVAGQPRGGSIWFDTAAQKVMLYDAPNTWVRE